MATGQYIETLILTGPVGSGKTATAIAVGHMLGEHGLQAVVVDLDWLGWLHTASREPLADDLIATNLAAIWPNFVATGIRYAVLSRGLTSLRALEALKRAVPQARITVVRLSATAPTLEARLRRRDTGAELNEHLRQAVEMTRTMERLALEDLVVSTDGADVDAIAAQIVRRLGWTARS